jgi:hypothetical protein
MNGSVEPRVGPESGGSLRSEDGFEVRRAFSW